MMPLVGHIETGLKRHRETPIGKGHRQVRKQVGGEVKRTSAVAMSGACAAGTVAGHLYGEDSGVQSVVKCSELWRYH